MKKVIFILLLSLVACRKTQVIPTPEPKNEKIFTKTENTITDGQSIYFDLPTADVYTLTLIDKETGEVISRERFNGKIGENVKKVYTKSIKSRYLYLLLENVTKTEIGKTTIILN